MSHADDEIQTINSQFVEKFLLRFTSNHLKQLFPLVPQSIRTKFLMVKNVTNLYFPNGLSYADVAKLDLDLIQTKENKQWTAYKLGFKLLDGERLQPELDVGRLTQVLRDELSAFYNHFTSAHLFEGSTWIRINIDLHKTDIQNTEVPAFSTIWSTTYVVCHPHGRYILVHGILSSQKKFIFHALQSALKCHSIEPASLHGSNIESLIDLINNKESQGFFRDYRVGSIDLNPLDRSSAKPQLIPKPKDVPNVIIEDQHVIEARNTTLRKLFGTSDEPQPIIENAVFSIELPCSKDNHFPLSFTVKFCGPNILEGIKECIQQGLITTPVPPLFEQIACAAQNSFKRSTV